VRQLLRRDDRRNGLLAGIYFRPLLIGYFESINSERGTACRTADSLALREFLGVTASGASVAQHDAQKRVVDF
jgi:hypothetical protein